MRRILERLSKGLISIEEAELSLKSLTISEVENMAKLDIKREIRIGIPEIILAEGKSITQLEAITNKMITDTGKAIISRIESENSNIIKNKFKDFLIEEYASSKILIIKKSSKQPTKIKGKVGILSAGTADIPIAEEARIILNEMGCEVITEYDVGVAGLQRLFPAINKMLNMKVDVIIAVAGREGALPTVIAGLVDIPIIGVPTSMGYGFGEKGTSALMSMLQSCSLGIATVNIDSGIAAGILAIIIIKRIHH